MFKEVKGALTKRAGMVSHNTEVHVALVILTSCSRSLFNVQAQVTHMEFG